MPNSEEDKRRREQQSEHITKGRECERHLSPGCRFLARFLLLADDAGTNGADLRDLSLMSASFSSKESSQWFYCHLLEASCRHNAPICQSLPYISTAVVVFFFFLFFLVCLAADVNKRGSLF